MLVRDFIKWAGWSITEYQETPFDIVDEWWQTWQAEVRHANSKDETAT